LEQLEDRSLLSAFASIQGVISQPGGEELLPIHIDTAYFSLHRWGAYLGFETHPTAGSQLDPHPVQIQPLGNKAGAAVWQSLDSAVRSVSLATVRPGNFQLVVSGDNNTTGAYQVDVFLVGDANGDRQVDQRDVQLIHTLRGKRLGQPGYQSDADANRDGVINAVDEGLAQANLKAATILRQLTVTLGVDPALDPHGTGVVQSPAITLVGLTAPRTTLRLDQGADGVFDQQTTAGLGGLFQFNTFVPTGLTPFRVEATDAFGQRTSTELSVTGSFNRSALPGQPQGISWNIGGDATGLDVVIRAQAPGDVFDPHGSFAVTPGTRPAAGPVFFLKTDNTWASQDTVFTSGQTSGTTHVALPTTAEGEWRLDILTRDHASGQIKSVDSQTVLVSSKPAIDLRLNRTLANSDDAIHAELLTSAGQTPQDVAVVATLTLPDGRDVSLPGFGPATVPLYQGKSSDAQYTLLAQPLDLFGPGAYHLAVRLLDGSGQHFLAIADTDLTISDTPGRLSGKVFDAAGNPVDGSAAASAFVEALDIDDGTVSAQGSIAADGTYQLSLDPGRYLVTATVLDAQGGVSQASAGNITVIGPDGANVMADLTGTSSGTGKTAAVALEQAPVAERFATTLRAAAAGHLPPVHVFVQVSVSGDAAAVLGNPSGLSNTLSGQLGNLLRNQDSGVRFTTQQDVQNLATEAERAQTNRTDTVEQLDNLSDAQGGEFLATASINKIGGKLAVTLKVLNPHNPGVPVATAQIVAPASSVQDVVNLLQQAVSQEGSLQAGLEAVRLKPVEPHLRVYLNNDSPSQGGQILAIVRVVDADGKPMPGLNVTLVNKQPLLSHQTQSASGTTHDDGTFQTTFDAGGETGEGRITAFYDRGKEEFTSDPSAGGAYRVVGQTRLRLLAAKYELRSGDTAPVNLVLFGNDGQHTIPSALVRLTAVGGTLSDSQVTTSATGGATFTFTAGTTNGNARVTATYDFPPTAGRPPAQLTTTLDFLITGAVTENLNARASGTGTHAATQLRAAAQTTPTVIDGAAAELFADVQVGGDEVAALPIRFTLAGAGALNDAEGQTDDLGEANAFYVPPADGSGIATITAITTVDGKDYTKSIDVAYQPPPQQDIVVGIKQRYGAEVAMGASFQFGAYVDGTTNIAVTWSATGGTVSSTGLYTAGNVPGNYTITATSVADPTKSDTKTIQIARNPFYGAVWSGTWMETVNSVTRQFYVSMLINDFVPNEEDKAVLTVTVAYPDGSRDVVSGYMQPADISGNTFTIPAFRNGAGFTATLNSGTLTGSFMIGAFDDTATFSVQRQQ
jgi:hypothetical protein